MDHFTINSIYRHGPTRLLAQIVSTPYLVTDLRDVENPERIWFVLPGLGTGGVPTLHDFGYERMPGQKFPYGFLVEPDLP